jgi:hypothetical protein
MGTAPVSVLKRSRSNNIQPMDVWYEVMEKENFPKEKTYTRFEHDVLALVVHLIDAGVEYHDIYERLTTLSINNTPTTSTDIEKAEKIRTYFKNKHMLRMLKGEHISEFMSAVDEIIASPFSLCNDHYKIIVKLPAFYEENIQTEQLYKNYNNLSPNSKAATKKDIWTFVAKIAGNAKNDKNYTFYFKNLANNLLTVVVGKGEIGYGVWNYVAETKKSIGIEAHLKVHKKRGYNFIMYGLPSKYDLFDPR